MCNSVGKNQFVHGTPQNYGSGPGNPKMNSKEPKNYGSGLRNQEIPTFAHMGSDGLPYLGVRLSCFVTSPIFKHFLLF